MGVGKLAAIELENALSRTKGKGIEQEAIHEPSTLDEPLSGDVDVAAGMLSDREREVLFLAGDGMTDKEIALKLQIGPKTVRTYWDRMRAKLGAASRTEVLAKALRAALDELGESEQRIRTFVQHMPVVFTALDEAGNVILVNDEWSRLTGYATEELSQTSALAERMMPDPEYRNRVLREFAEKQGDYRDLEMTIVCADGSERTIAWSSRAKENPVLGWASWSTGIDITARKRAQLALQQSEESLRKLLQTSEQGVWMVDKEQTTTFVNERLATMLGCKVEDVVGQRPAFFQEGASGDLLREMLLSSPAGGGRIAFTTKFRRANGAELWAHVSVNPLYADDGSLTGHAALITDITSRRRAESARDQAMQAYNTLLNAVSDRIMRFNRDLSCVYANFELESAPSGESPIVEGRSWDDLKGLLKPAKEWSSTLKEVLSTGKKAYMDSAAVGEGIPVSVLFLPEVSQQGVVSHVLAVCSLVPSAVGAKGVALL